MLLGKGPALGLFLKTLQTSARCKTTQQMIISWEFFPYRLDILRVSIVEKRLLKKKKKCAIFLLGSFDGVYILSVQFCVLSLILKVEKLLGWKISPLTPLFGFLFFLIEV